MYTETSSGANLSTAQAITTTAASTNVFDVTGAGAGNVPSMIGANGLSSHLGYDIGGGDGAATPQIVVSLGTCTTVSGTLNFEVQCAPDNGSGSAGSYVTLYESAAFTGTSQLYKGAIFILPIPMLPAGLIASNYPPRFYQVNYVVGSSISVIVTANLLLDGVNPSNIVLYGKNFPAGL